MNKQELIQEHKRLIRVLSSGSKLEQQQEANRQAKELQGYLKPEKKSKVSDDKTLLGIKGLV